MKIFANKKTKVAHRIKRNDSCRQHFLVVKNVQQFKTLEQAIDAGYRACKRCKPE